MCGHYSSIKISSIVGGSFFTFTNASVDILEPYIVQLINTPTTYIVKYNSYTSGPYTHGASTSTQVLAIGARSDGSHAYNGHIAYIAIYDKYGYIIECVDFTNVQQFVGGKVYGINGTPFTLVGSAASAFTKVGIPLAKLSY